MNRLLVFLFFCLIGLGVQAQDDEVQDRRTNQKYEAPPVEKGERNEHGEKIGEWKSYYQNGKLCTVPPRSFGSYRDEALVLGSCLLVLGSCLLVLGSCFLAPQ